MASKTGDTDVKSVKVSKAFEGNFPRIFAADVNAPAALANRAHYINDTRLSGKKAGAFILVIKDTYVANPAAPAPAATDAALYVASGPEPTDPWFKFEMDAGVVVA